MKLKKSLLAGVTAATLAIAGTGIATAQDGSLPGSLSTSSETESSDLSSITSSLGEGSSDGSSEGSSDFDLDAILGSLGEDGIGGSLTGLFDDGAILGSFVTGEDGDWTDGVVSITRVISLIVAAVGLGSLAL